MIKFLTLNVEFGCLLDKQIELFKEYCPDVVCLQELAEPHLQAYEQTLGLKSIFVPAAKYDDLEGFDVPTARGVGILYNPRKLSLTETKKHILHASSDEVLVMSHNDEPAEQQRSERNLLMATFALPEGSSLTIGTTHFSKKSDLTEGFRSEAITKLIEALNIYDSFVMGADLNANREDEAYLRLVEKFTDQTPLELTTTIDLKNHQAHINHGVVFGGVYDHIISKNESVQNITVIDDVSDHVALVGEIDR